MEYSGKSKRQLATQDKYDKQFCRKVNLKLNIATDADVIAKLESVPAKQTYIKELVRKDIKRNG